MRSLIYSGNERCGWTKVFLSVKEAEIDRPYTHKRRPTALLWAMACLMGFGGRILRQQSVDTRELLCAFWVPKGRSTPIRHVDADRNARLLMASLFLGMYVCQHLTANLRRHSPARSPTPADLRAIATYCSGTHQCIRFLCVSGRELAHALHDHRLLCSCRRI